MIELRDLEVMAGTKIIARMPRLEVAPAERLLLLGGNGAGKTSILRVLAGLEPNHRGALRGLPALRKRALVHQAPIVLHGDLRHNVGIGLRARRLPGREREERVERMLEHFGLTSMARRSARSLSGGERRRVALARALVLEPELLLLDEPLADLDQAGRDALEEALAALPDCTLITASPTPLPDFLAGRTLALESSCGGGGRDASSQTST